MTTSIKVAEVLAMLDGRPFKDYERGLICACAGCHNLSSRHEVFPEYGFGCWVCEKCFNPKREVKEVEEPEDE